MKVSIIKEIKKGTHQQQKLVLNISGKKVNHKFINCLRRITKLLVPTYAFYLFEFQENTTVYNNDMMKLRLMQMTPQDINVKVDYLDPIYELQSFNDYDDSRRQRHEKDDVNYRFQLNVKNKTNETYMDVTTDDVKFFLNEKLVKSPQPKLLITRLRKGDTLVCNGKAILGTGLGPKIKEYRPNEIWSASGNTYYEEIKENEYIFTVESKGQMSEYVILSKCCKIAIHKLDLLKKLIEINMNETKNKNLDLLIEDDESIASVVVFELQQMKNEISTASCARKEAPYYVSTIKVSTIDKDVMKIVIDAIENVKTTFAEFNKQLDSIKK